MRLYRTRRRYWLLGIVILSGLAWLPYHLARPRELSLWQIYAQINEGMTEEQVDALLGEPFSYSIGGLFGCCGVEPLSNFGAIKQKFWVYDDATIHVGFDEQWRVRCKCGSNVWPPPSALEEMRWFYGDLVERLRRGRVW